MKPFCGICLGLTCTAAVVLAAPQSAHAKSLACDETLKRDFRPDALTEVVAVKVPEHFRQDG